MPEARIVLGHAASFLALCRKSNAAYRGIDAALAEVRDSGTLGVPLHLRNAPTALMRNQGYGKGYRYPHDHADGAASQSYLPEPLEGRRFLEPKPDDPVAGLVEERRRKG